MKKIVILALIAMFWSVALAAGESINLAAGKNLVSLSLQPPNTSVEAVFVPVLDKVKAVKGYDNSSGKWLKYKPGGKKNTLSAMGQMGVYQITMKEPAALEMNGWAQLPPVVSLHFGNNIVGYAGPEGRVLDQNYIIASGLSGFISFKDYDDKSTPTTLRRGGVYAVRVPKGRSLIWNQDPQPPMAPVLTAQAGDGQITLNWENVPGALSYNIYWSESPGVTTLTGTMVSSVTSPYVHSGLVNGTTYSYVLTAVSRAGESLLSEEVSATPHSPGWVLEEGLGVESLVFNSHGELYVAGDYCYLCPQKDEIFLAKLSSEGQVQCINKFGTENRDNSPRLAIFNDTLYMAWPSDPLGIGDATVYLSQFDSQCNEIPRTLVAEHAMPCSISIDQTGIYITVDKGVGIMVKTDFDGNIKWTLPFFEFNILFGAAVADGLGNIYAAGYNDNMFIGKYKSASEDDTLVDPVWVRWWGGQDFDFAFGVVVSSDGKQVFVLGESDFSLFGGTNYHTIVSYDDKGNFLWANDYFSGNGQLQTGYFHDNALYVVGYPASPIKINPIDGSQIWAFTDYVNSARSVVVSQGVVFVANGTNTILRLDAATGQPIQ